MSPTLTILKNAAANVTRGSASALVAITVPYFLVRSLSASDYGVWVLALQMSAYVGYFDFGLQTAIARFVAQTLQTQDRNRHNQVVSSAAFLLSIAALIATIGIAILIVALPAIYRTAAPDQIATLRLCISLVGGSLTIGLLASPLTGVLLGHEKNEIPAMAIGGCKLTAGAVIILIARYWPNIVTLAAILGGFNILSYLIQFLAVRQMLPDLRIAPGLVSRKIVEQFIGYCATLSTSSAGMFLVSGLDLAIVGHFQFSSVVAYSTAATVITFLAGINTSIFSSLLAPAAKFHVKGQKQRLGDLVLYATRAAVIMNLAAGIPLIVLARAILSLWVGDKYAITAAPILQILVAANVVRLVFDPFTVAVWGTGEQRRIILSPILEGVVNLCASIFGVIHWGAIGVAIGTLVGSTFSFTWAYFYNLRSVDSIHLDSSDLARDSILRPLLCFFPVALVLTFFSRIPMPYFLLPLTFAMSLSVGVVARWGRLNLRSLRELKTAE